MLVDVGAPPAERKPFPRSDARVPAPVIREDGAASRTARAGQMTQALLIVAWPYNGQVLTSFRFATAYKLPEVYTGNAVLTQISSSVNATNYELIYRCQNCFAWNQAGSTGNVSSSAGSFVIGRAQARSPADEPGLPRQDFLRLPQQRLRPVRSRPSPASSTRPTRPGPRWPPRP